MTEYAPKLSYDMPGPWTALAKVCSRNGFEVYARRYQQQLLIQKLRPALDYLPAAFRNLPKLRSILFADWRALARHGESCNELSYRIFGSTFPPCPLPQATTSAKRDEQLATFLSAIAQCPPHIKNLSIGHSDFDIPSFWENTT